MALVPDAGFYLLINSPQPLVERVLSSGRGFAYWESGMDLYLGEDFYDSFVEYQKRMLKVFDRMTNEYSFHTLNASRSVRSVAADLRRAVAKLLDEGQPVSAVADLTRVTAGVPRNVSVQKIINRPQKATDL